MVHACSQRAVLVARILTDIFAEISLINQCSFVCARRVIFAKRYAGALQAVVPQRYAWLASAIRSFLWLELEDLQQSALVAGPRLHYHNARARSTNI